MIAAAAFGDNSSEGFEQISDLLVAHLLDRVLPEQELLRQQAGDDLHVLRGLLLPAGHDGRAAMLGKVPRQLARRWVSRSSTSAFRVCQSTKERARAIEVMRLRISRATSPALWVPASSRRSRRFAAASPALSASRFFAFSVFFEAMPCSRSNENLPAAVVPAAIEHATKSGQSDKLKLSHPLGGNCKGHTASPKGEISPARS